MSSPNAVKTVEASSSNQEWDKLCEAVLRGILKHSHPCKPEKGSSSQRPLAARLQSIIKKIAKVVCKDIHKSISWRKEEWTYCTYWHRMCLVEETSLRA